MFICPECFKKFETEENIRLHFLKCWKEYHTASPNKPAPQSEDIIKRTVNNDIANFFERINDGRSSH